MALAKISMNAVAKPVTDRIFLFSAHHVDQYHKNYAQYDFGKFGPNRCAVIIDSQGNKKQIKYTHTTLASLDCNVDAIKRTYKIEDAHTVWHGSISKIIYFGPDFSHSSQPPANAL